MMKTLAEKIPGIIGTLLLLACPAFAQTYSIDTFTIAGGSGTVSGGAYSISGTVGQPDGNLALSGGVFSMDGGFWSIIDGSAPPADLRIIAVDRSGADLRLSFTSVAGQNYAIQGRADLASGTWTTLPGAPTSGTGGTIAVTLPNALGQPQQFYRVKTVP